ncbi:MAG: NifB/NifX family molybdenum-iron cluster-binding protein [Chloroflexota bacterium]|nr:NifB/NifX family molybdenum-iron cluster-binding protein [Chloroflexota bacterium]
MKIAVSATGTNLDAEVDPRFGRCQYLIFVDTDTMEFEAQSNANIAASGGAGISTAQAVAGQGVEAVLTGNVGPNAHQVLAEVGIQVITGVSGKVSDAIESYKDGRLKQSSGPTVKAHSGMGRVSQVAHKQVGPQDDIETIGGQVRIMQQQLNDVLRRIDDLEKKQR